MLGLAKARPIGLARYIITATTPFTRDDLPELRTNAPDLVHRHVPQYAEVYRQRGWRMFPSIDRVYVNERARTQLGWEPRYDFAHAVDLIAAGEDSRSPLARAIGVTGYHPTVFADGPYPVE